jgi:hypothetical protein
MTFALMGLGPSFDIQEWRESLIARRNLVRALVAEAVGGERQLELMLKEVKRAVRYHMMSEKDQASFRVMVYNTRAIVGGWRRLTAAERAAFLSGKTPYSTTFKIVRERI